MHYLIDIGNTFIKITPNQAKLSIDRISHQETDKILTLLNRGKIKQITMTAGRSDTAKKTMTIIINAARTQNIDLSLVEVNPKLLKIKYQDTSLFGVDRFLNLLAAREKLNNNFCVVSCGTAITLDFYTNQHIGGMIVPGIRVSREFLSEKTGLDSVKKPTDLLGNDTASSIGSGIYFGYQNLIFASIKNIENTLNQHFRLIFTGGDAEVLSKKNEIIPELLFKGMQKYHFLTT